MTTLISIARTTASDILDNNQGTPLTLDAAEVLAREFDRLLIERTEALYPQAEVEVIEGDGIRRVSVSTDEDQEATIEITLDFEASEIWESEVLWSIVKVCAYCTSEWCHAEIESVPEADDDAAWEEKARQHTAACEWIETRAHQIEQGG